MKKVFLKKEYIRYVFYLVFIILTAITIYRAFWGIEITDEAFYLAEGKTVLEGNYPYAYNNSLSVGQTIIMFPFVWVFKLFSPSYTGYFLYMRISFIIFKSCILLICYRILRQLFEEFYASIFVISLVGYNLYSIQNFSYNTISIYLLLIIGILVLFLQQKKVKHYLISYFLVGVLCANMVFAHPAQAINVIYFFILLMIFSTDWKNVLSYICGGLSQILVLFFIIEKKAGLRCLFQGLFQFIEGSNSTARVVPNEVIYNVWGSYGHIWKLMVCTYIFVLLALLFVKKRREFFINNIFIRQYSLYIATVIGIIIASLSDYRYIIKSLGACGLLCLLFIILFDYKNKSIWCIGVPFVLFICFEMFATTSSSPSNRFVFGMPALLIIMLTDNAYKIKEYGFLININKIMLLMLTVLIIIVEFKGLLYVYEEDDLSKLNYRIEEGIFKGIYTSEKRAKATIELERYIKANTGVNEYIAFRDNVPVGYLMMNGYMCDIMSWDCMQYSYGQNDPSKLYSYYKRVNNIPDKIIYIDFGRDKELSINSDSYLYNNFVEKNYIKIDENNIDNMYHILIYRSNDDSDKKTILNTIN